MVTPHGRDYLRIMTNTTLAPATPSVSAIRPFDLVASLVLAAFGAFSIWVLATQGGYGGFVELVRRDRWALQILLDLVIMAWFALGWLRIDARKRGIATWPYVVTTLLLGSIGILLYCVRRAFTPPRGT